MILNKNNLVRIFVFMASIIEFLIFINNPVLGLVLPIILIILSIFDKLDYKKIIFAYVLIYPVLPLHVGFDLGGGLPVFTIGRIVSIALFLLLLSKGVLLKIIKEFLEKSFVRNILLFLFFTMGLTAFFSALSFKATLFFIVSFFLERIFFAIIVFHIIDNEKDENKLVKGIVIVAFIISIIAIVEKITGVNIYSLLPTFNADMAYAVTQQMREGAIRVRSTFDHAITCGVYLSMVIPLAIMQIKNRKKLFIVLISIVLAIVFTQSRSAYINVIITFIFYFLYQLLNYKKKWVLLALFL